MSGENQYTPWIELGITEVEYWKRVLLKKSQESQEIVEATRRVIDWQHHSCVIEGCEPGCPWDNLHAVLESYEGGGE